MIEHISDTAGFESLRDEWRDLLASSATDNLFLTWEWLFTWWKHLAEGRRLLLLAVRQGGTLVGLAPLALGWRRVAAALGAPMVEFLGSGSAGSDYLDIIARCGRERGVVRAVAHHLASQGAMLSLSRVGPEGAIAAAIGVELQGHGWKLVDSTTDVCPYIPLTGHTGESYLASLGPEHRYAVRRKLRSLERGHEVRFEEARSEDERREALRILIDLHLARWNERGGTDAFHTPQLRAFHEEFTRIALAHGWLRLFVLRLDAVPVAAFYGLRYGRTFYFYQSGFDPAFSRESPGLVCMALAIRRAIQEGAAEFDLLHGAEPYKLHWAREIRLLGRLEVFPPRAQALLWRQALVLGRSARRAAGRLIHGPRAKSA